VCQSADPAQTERLLEQVSQGDHRALDRLLDQHRAWLGEVIKARIEPALRQRVDPSDVLQETLMVASQRIEDFLQRRPTSFRIWLRRKALERLVDARRMHRAQKRNVARDVGLSDASSLAIAQGLLVGRPSESLKRQELAERVRQALGQLGEPDREVLVLRHVEGLTNIEVAEVLEVTADAASKRYGRALRRLSVELAALGVSSTGQSAGG
jgi:RNA polymerase sigma-70 factor (ECF subfamily)